MRGLYISFVIKRRKKIDKIMDFFLVIAIFIFIFTFLFYVQYVQKENKYNSTDKNLQTQNIELKTLNEKYDAISKENASDLERNYNKAYDELVAVVDEVALYKKYINDIYNAKYDGKKVDGVSISGISISTQEKSISLSLVFDIDEYSSEIIYKYRAALLEYDWIPKDGIVYEEGPSQTWEVKVDGTTTKE